MSELNYAGSEISGFGSHSAAEVEQLQKALGPWWSRWSIWRRRCYWWKRPIRFIC